MISINTKQIAYRIFKRQQYVYVKEYARDSNKVWKSYF